MRDPRAVISRTFITVALGALTICGTPALGSGLERKLYGEWGELMVWRGEVHPELDFDLSPIHAVLTHDGNVLLWGLGTCHEPPFDHFDDIALWDPVGNTFTTFDFPDSQMFCAGQAVLADGRVLVAGGGCREVFGGEFTVDFARMYSLDDEFQPWTHLNPMNDKRWYPTVTALPDGRMLVSSGTSNEFGIVPFPEIFDPDAVTIPWQSLDRQNIGWPLYPFMFVLPDGGVFYAGPDNANVGASFGHHVFDVDTETWSFVTTSPSGNMESAAMYQPGKIIKAGQGNSYSIDMTASSPSWQQHANMVVSRSHHDLVLLPNGWVLSVGGNENDKRAEWTNPNETDPKKKQWLELAEMDEDLDGGYHSIAILLPDGRVLASGGAGGSLQDVYDTATAQVFSPPYLFWGGRPEVECVPQQIHYGATFFVDVADGKLDIKDIAEVNLIRPGAVTHSFDHNQRFLQLTDDPIIHATTNQLEIPSPANANIAPPGYYMLFLISKDGVPSVAEFVRVMDCPPCLDITGSGSVDVGDLLKVLADWGPCPDCNDCVSDLNGDCVVNVQDLLMLLANWGECTTCDAACPPSELNECWEKYKDDYDAYKACVEEYGL